MTPCSQMWKPRFGGVRWAPIPCDLACCLTANGTGPFLSLSSSPHFHTHMGWPALVFKSPSGSFLPSHRLGSSEGLESCSSCSKLNYIHQPGTSTIVPKAFPALIRIFLFSLREEEQPISASISLPGARTWNCRARGLSDGAARRAGREGI